MPKFTKSFPTDNADKLIRRLIGVGGATIRRVTQNLTGSVKIDLSKIETGVLATIDAPDIDVARTIVGRLTTIATSEPVRGFYSPSSTRRELVGMLIGKKRVILKSIGEKNNVKIFYKDDEGRFTIEGISRVDVDNAIRDLQSRDKKAQKKLGGPTVINLDDDDVSGVPVSLPRAVIDLDYAVAGAGADDELDQPPSIRRTWTTPDGTLGGEDPLEDPLVSQLIRAITGMLEQSGKFNDCSPENTLRMMNCAKRIAYTQLARNVDWEQMILGAEIAISDL